MSLQYDDAAEPLAVLCLEEEPDELEVLGDSDQDKDMQSWYS